MYKGYSEYGFSDLIDFVEQIKEAKYDEEKLKLSYWDRGKKPRTKAEKKDLKVGQNLTKLAYNII